MEHTIVKRELERGKNNMHFMKETIGMILILVFVISIEIIITKITNDSLDTVNSEIGIIEKQESKDDLKDAIKSFSKTWEEEEKKLSCFMEHNELEEITKNVNSLVFSIENGKEESIKEKINDIKFKMEHIKNKQKIKLENIF